MGGAHEEEIYSSGSHKADDLALRGEPHWSIGRGTHQNGGRGKTQYRASKKMEIGISRAHPIPSHPFPSNPPLTESLHRNALHFQLPRALP